MKGKRWIVQVAGFVKLLIPLALMFVLPVVSAALEVGEKAPDFELQSTTGKKIRLSDFAGKKNVLIEFYVMDFNPGFEVAHKTRRAAYGKLKEMDTEIVGISLLSPYAQHAFARTLDLPYPLLSDFPNLATIKKYDVENQIGSVSTAKRAYFIVDKKGIVRFKRIMGRLDTDGSFLRNAALLNRLMSINNNGK